MAKPKPPPPPRPEWRTGDIVVLRQGQDYVEGEIIATVVDGRYKVQGDNRHRRGDSQEDLGRVICLGRSLIRVRSQT
jgi:signal peptidase I